MVLAEAMTMVLVMTVIMMTPSQCAATSVSSRPPGLFVSRHRSSMGPPLGSEASEAHWERWRPGLLGSAQRGEEKAYTW
jgi:hypothetical protein